MKIGITDTTGFISSHLLERLSKSKENEIALLRWEESAEAIQKLKKIKRAN